MVAGDFSHDSTLVQHPIYITLSAILTGTFRDCPWARREHESLGRWFTFSVLCCLPVNPSSLCCERLRIKYTESFEKGLFSGNWTFICSYCTYDFQFLNPQLAHLPEAECRLSFFTSTTYSEGTSLLFAFLLTEATITPPVHLQRRGGGCYLFLYGITNETIYLYKIKNTNSALNKCKNTFNREDLKYFDNRN